MKIIQSLSIKNKLIFIILSVTILSLSIGFTIDLIKTHEASKDKLISESLLNAKLVSEYCITPLDFGYNDEANVNLSKLETIPTIYNGYVFDLEGHVFASYNRTELINIPELPIGDISSFFEDDWLHIFRKIKFNEEIRGTIYLRVSTAELYKDLRSNIISKGFIGIVLILIAFFIAFRLERIISQPILALADTAKKISLEDDYTIRLESRSTDEIGVLYNSFNNMLEQIKTRENQRDKAEEALKESEEKLNALFNSLTEMVVMNELVQNAAGEAIDYRIIDCNKVFTELTGISKEDAIGKLASKVYQTDPPPYMEEFAKVALGGDPYEFTDFFPPLDKHLLISVVSPQAGKFATITTDISDMMQIQEIIMAKNKEMENYLYVTSHDLRTPLVNIQGFSQQLKKQADSIKNLFADKTLEPEILHQLGNITDEDIPKTLSFVHSNIEKMDSLINGLLQLSRTGRVEINIQKIDMNALFANIIQRFDFQIKEAQCEIHINPLPGCYGDAALLDQLFANIISNALKYSDSERALEITVNAKNTYNRVVYTIRDTGKGIAQKHLDKIWDVFYRIDPRSVKTGEGIGLSLVKRIAEKHKGKVWTESEENKGSVFHIELHNRSFTEL